MGTLDTIVLFMYAFGTFLSGFIADRVDIRYFLTAGMILTGLGCGTLGLGKFFNIHHIAFYYAVGVSKKMIKVLVCFYFYLYKSIIFHPLLGLS